MPGLDTSSVYSLAIGSATSSTAETARLMRAQSSTSMPPSGRSAMICSTGRLLPISRRRTSSNPMPSMVGATMPARRRSMAALATRSAKQGSTSTKNGRAARRNFRWKADREINLPLMSVHIGAAPPGCKHIRAA